MLETRKAEDSILYMKGISKTFGGTRALINVDLTLKSGEILGLLGQNGSGKSTLIKVLAGYHAPDPGGELWINGERAPLPMPPGAFAKHLISFVHQDLGLVEDLTVLENFYINRTSTQSSLFINWNSYRQRALEVFARYDIHLNPNSVVSSLGAVERAMLAIMRAVEDIESNRATQAEGITRHGILVLDEPTVFLPQKEVNALFRLVRNVAQDGFGVIFISHDLDEVKRLTDSFIVLRDGRNAGQAVTSDCTTERIIEMLLGKTLDRYVMSTNKQIVEGNDRGMKVTGLCGETLRDFSFTVKAGEVLGITGLVGSGFEEVPYLLFGAQQDGRGEMDLFGERIQFANFDPQKAVKAKMALIPSDRPNMGAIGDLLVKENMLMQILPRFNKMRLNLRAMDQTARDTITRYRVHPMNPNLLFSQLSGGNQQKILLSKWILADSRVLILHEPTQGVDVGARQEIYRHVENAAKNETCIICCSSDYEQLEQICDRVIVLVRGRISAELLGDEITKDNLIQCCFAAGSAESSAKPS